MNAEAVENYFMFSKTKYQFIQYKTDIILTIFISIIFIIIISYSNDPLRLTGDFFGDEFANESAIHFSEYGFINCKFLMARNYGELLPQDFYVHHAGFFSYSYGLAYKFISRSLQNLRIIASLYSVIMVLGLYSFLSAMSKNKKLALFTIILLCLNPQFFLLFDALENTAYITPFLFWIIFLYHKIAERPTAEYKWKYLSLLFLLSFIDARFSHVSIIYLFPMLLVYNIIFFDKTQVQKRLLIWGIILLGQFLSTLLYFWQHLWAKNTSLLALISDLLSTISSEQKISEKVNIWKIPFYFMTVPPHFLFFLWTLFIIIFNWKKLRAETSLKNSLQVFLITSSSGVLFVLLLWGKFFQHSRQYAFLYLIPLYIFSAAIFLTILKKDFNLNLYAKKVLISLFIVFVISGCFWIGLENRIRLELHDDLLTYQEFKPHLTGDAKYLTNYNNVAIHHYIQQRVANFHGGCKTIADADRLIEKFSTERNLYFLISYNQNIKNPTQINTILILRRINSLFPNIIRQKIEYLLNKRFTINIKPDLELKEYIAGKFQLVAESSNKKAALFKIKYSNPN